MINFTIILADDEQQILYGMKNGIDWESLGFSVVGTAQNGKEALELIEEHHPDLLISDIKMPFMDGLELSKTIHENYINTKIILFSGWDDFEYARTAISYGVSQYIMKPLGEHLHRKYSSSSAAVFYTAFNRNSYRRLLYSSNEKFKTEF